jgi:hypothetical protein
MNQVSGSGIILQEAPRELRSAVMDSCLEKLERTLSATIGAIPAEAMNWHPPGKWCAAEILEHLYLTYTGTTKGFERVLAAGKPQTSSKTLRLHVRTLAVCGLGYLPEGRKAPPHATPRGLPAEKVLAEIGAKIAAMDEVIRRCESQFGVRVRLLDHPILGALTAKQWRKFHLVHGLHHVKQIRRLQEGWVARETGAEG